MREVRNLDEPWDVLVAGARCAGAPLAMLLARQGRRVLLVDRASFPSDTLSTHFIPTRGAALLKRWGLLERLEATGCPSLDTMLLDYGAVSLRGRPDAVDGAASMYAPRRTYLDHMLVQAAEEAGATVREETALHDLLWDGERVVGARLRRKGHDDYDARARIVIGADGLNSRVARAANANYRTYEAPISCVYLAYWRGVAGDGVEFYLRKDRLILVFPTHDDLACVYVGWPHAAFAEFRGDVEANYLATLTLAPGLAARVNAGERASPYRGTNKLPNYYRQAHGPGWALVGDAAYHRDPTTGMGISDAFLGAALLADAIGKGLGDDHVMAAEIAAYEAAFDGRTRHLFDLTLRSARLSDPAPLWDFYAGIGTDAAESSRLFNVVCGLTPFAEVFNADNLRKWSKVGAVNQAAGGGNPAG